MVLKYDLDDIVVDGPPFDVPPSIYQGPSMSTKIYRQDDNVDLLCVASGYPPPTYVSLLTVYVSFMLGWS